MNSRLLLETHSCGFGMEDVVNLSGLELSKSIEPLVSKQCSETCKATPDQNETLAHTRAVYVDMFAD